MPDHSLIQWEVMVGSMEVKVEEEGQQVGKMRMIVPENYLQKEVEKSEIKALTSRVMQAGANQKEIDDVYEELVEVMKWGLVEVSRKKGERRQPWFSREMAKLRKVFHDSEKEWLNCDSKETRREKRREYVEKRRKYKKAVSRAKRKFEEDRQVKLEKLIRSPRKWWAEVRKLGLIGGKKKDMTGRVYDEGGVIRQGKEVVEVWRSYFEKVLNEGGNSEDQGGGDVLGGESSWIEEGITREEVEPALGKLKRRAAPGTDGLTAEMVGSKELVDFWHCLFNWCWANGMIPTEWRRSIIVPIPKKRVRGVCRMDEFRGISLVPVAYKAMCGIIQERLTQVVGERNLVAEEQGGFRRGRGCRDQLLTLMLLGQIKAMSKRGMFAGFIDFRKAYDKVDHAGEIVGLFGKDGTGRSCICFFEGSLYWYEQRGEGGRGT